MKENIVSVGSSLSELLKNSCFENIIKISILKKFMIKKIRIKIDETFSNQIDQKSHALKLFHLSNNSKITKFKVVQLSNQKPEMRRWVNKISFLNSVGLITWVDSKNTLYLPSLAEKPIISGFDRKCVDGAKNL